MVDVIFGSLVNEFVSVSMILCIGVLVSGVLVYWYPVYWCIGIRCIGVLVSVFCFTRIKVPVQIDPPCNFPVGMLFLTVSIYWIGINQTGLIQVSLLLLSGFLTFVEVLWT